MAFHGVSAGPPPATLKVSVGSRAGFVGEGEISYAVPVRRPGRSSLEILEKRLRDAGLDAEQFRFERVGVDAIRRAPTRRFRETSRGARPRRGAGAHEPTRNGSAVR